MTYNLTEKQKELARWIVGKIRDGVLGEMFAVEYGYDGYYVTSAKMQSVSAPFEALGALDALASAGLLLCYIQTETSQLGRSFEARRECTCTAKLFKAFDTDFAEEPEAAPLSTLAHAAPPELNLSLDRLRKRYPDPAKLGFLIMRFGKPEPYGEIVKVIQETAAKHGIAIVRADGGEFHAHLWENVRTFLHGCSFGVAIYERIEQDEPNANIGLEVGYLLAMDKPVLLLKERTLKALQTDLMGRLYREFDEHNAAGTIPEQLERWLIDYGVIVPPHA